MSDTSDVEMESNSRIRYEWLHTLKKDELKVLCSNRDINTETTTKTALIKSLLEAKPLQVSDRMKKDTLILELKAKGLESKANDMNKNDLIALLNKHKKKKLTEKNLEQLILPELQKLCLRRNIVTKDYSSKKGLSKLLQSTNASDPTFTESMTSKQLSAEMKARGLAITGLKKEDMLKVLRSDTTYEQQQLNTHTHQENVDDTLQTVKYALRDFIDYTKNNTQRIQKSTKKNMKTHHKKKDTEKRDYLLETEWRQLEECLRDARDEIKDIRTMFEAYGGGDLGRDEAVYKHFDNVVDYEIESEIEENGDTNIVYVVYNADDKLILNQDKNAILGVFQDEDKAEKLKKRLLIQNKQINEIGIQQIKVNDYYSAESKNRNDED